LIVVWFVAAVFAAPMSGASATTPGANGLLAFVRSGNVFTASATGAGVRQLTKGGGFALPRWSPNGKLIAYQKGGAVWTMNANGTGQTKRFTGHAASWSPDGTQLAYESTSSTCNEGRVSIGTLATHSSTQIDCLKNSDGPASLGRTTSWSPDGQRVLYDIAWPADPACDWCYDQTSLREYYLSTHTSQDLDINPPNEICEAAENTLDPDYAPSRDNVVISSDIPDCLYGGIWVLNRTYTYRKMIAAGGSFPVFAPDNAYVYFSEGTGTKANVQRVALGPGSSVPTVVVRNGTQPDLQPLH
jgi:Tol biopolymer transport system component